MSISDVLIVFGVFCFYIAIIDFIRRRNNTKKYLNNDSLAEKYTECEKEFNRINKGKYIACIISMVVLFIVCLILRKTYVSLISGVIIMIEDVLIYNFKMGYIEKNVFQNKDE